MAQRKTKPTAEDLYALSQKYNHNTDYTTVVTIYTDFFKTHLITESLAQRIIKYNIHKIHWDHQNDFKTLMINLSKGIEPEGFREVTFNMNDFSDEPEFDHLGEYIKPVDYTEVKNKVNGLKITIENLNLTKINNDTQRLYAELCTYLRKP